MFGYHLATLIHISDLHFGDMDPSRNDGTYDADAPRYWKHAKIFQGLLGHTVQAMKDLDRLVKHLVDEEGAYLITTGDLTCVGKATQFAMAGMFLGGEVHFPSGDAFGLRCRDWKGRCVGGNHDHWNEALPLLSSGTSAAYLRTFPAGTFPAMAPDVPLRLSDGRRLRVRFAMVDSDADVATGRMSIRRNAARGKFSSQLASPEIHMGPRQPDEIRTLLIHHSPTYHDGSSALRMHGNCRQALDVYLIDQEISVVMTGHIHEAEVRAFRATDPARGRTREVLEARSGTATQRDKIPAKWRVKDPHLARWQLPRNAVLVHRLVESEDESGGTVVEWRTTPYWRGNRGFVPLRGQLPPPRRVWP
ncbi:metallophosphoesterase [Paludisphaera sp.]|uniref:metallophosphoesterase family protein n=1 Tax=Paludisphaera sp. TaxID=2017432 RepID=UPI00301D472C